MSGSDCLIGTIIVVCLIGGVMYYIGKIGTHISDKISLKKMEKQKKDGTYVDYIQLHLDGKPYPEPKNPPKQWSSAKENTIGCLIYAGIFIMAIIVGTIAKSCQVS